MKELLILRHAKSDWSDGNLEDHDRPLNSRGKRAAAAIGTFLRQSGKLPDAIACSTAIRTRQTLEGLDLDPDDTVSGQQLEAPTVGFHQQLYHASLEEWLHCVQTELDTSKRLLVIGHEPSCSAALFHLTGCNSRFPTAALACVDCRSPRISADQPVDIRHGGQTLLWMVTPRLFVDQR